jgi:hypothetical protein
MPADPLALADRPVVRCIVNALGWFSLLATLALSAPGVVATANAEPNAEVRGPSCGAAERSGENAAAKLSQMVERLRAEAARQPDPSNEVVVLDTRGFSYPVGPPPRPSPNETRR